MAAKFSIYAVAQQHRSALLKREAEASARMVRLYMESARRIERQILQLALRYEEAVAANERVSPSWIYQQERLQMLLTQVQNEIARFSDIAGSLVEAQQREFAFAGAQDSQDVITLSREQAQTDANGAPLPQRAPASAAVGFGRLASAAAIEMAGFAADGSPLAELFAELGPAAAARIHQDLFAGLVQGFGAEKLARQVRNSLGGNMARAMLIGRTETLRAYRESSQNTFEENSDVVEGWRWIAACNGRTCPVCWAMHGSVHKVSEQFVSHPGCRCTPAPVTDMSPPLKAGPERFAALPEAQQLQVLGPLRFENYKRGMITLQDLVGTSTNQRWGMNLRERSLKDAIAEPRGERLPHLPKRSGVTQRERAA